MNRRTLLSVCASIPVTGCSSSDEDGIYTIEYSTTPSSTPDLKERAPNTNWPEFRFDSSNTAFNPADSSRQEEFGMRWVKNIPQPPAGPAVFDEKIIFSHNLSGGSSRIVAVDAYSGEQLWMHENDKYIQSWRSFPAVDETRGIVFINMISRSIKEDSPSKSSLEIKGHILALDLNKGELKWTVTLRDRVIPPKVIDDYLVIASRTDGITVLDIEDRSIVWQSDQSVIGGVGVLNGILYIQTKEEGLVANQLSDGAKLWSNQAVKNRGPPSITDGIVYSGSRNKKRGINAFDAISGTHIWEFTTNSGLKTPPIVTNDWVYAAELNGNFYCINAKTGEEKWNLNFDERITLASAISDSVLLGLESGSLVSLNRASGNEYWRYSIGARPHNWPIPARGATFIGTRNGGNSTLLAIENTPKIGN
jgi:outer membrane protein assembly factor BamB